MMMKHNCMPIGKHLADAFLLSKSQNVPVPVQAIKRGRTNSHVIDTIILDNVPLCLKFKRKSPLPEAACEEPKMCAKRKNGMKA